MDEELQATFIVRLRREPGTPAGEWRGEIEHVQSGALVRFADRDALSAFVWSRLADAERPQRPRTRGAARQEITGHPQRKRRDSTPRPPA